MKRNRICRRATGMRLTHGWPGDRQLYIYRKMFVAGKVIYQVSGQTQMRTKERDRAKVKTVVDSFRLK